MDNQNKRSELDINNLIKYFKEGYYQYHFIQEASDDEIVQFNQLVPHPQMIFKFDLYDYQKQAIVHIERNQHVMVVAPTASGKTLLAEYAIAKSINMLKRAIYISPTKALSNQKYHDFSISFNKKYISIITGDIEIGTCYNTISIMTAEILRSKLNLIPSFLNNVEWIIMDEAQYFTDKERGIVWEDILINLPKTVHVLFLSATIENVKDFMEWFGEKTQTISCLVTWNKRPIELKHYVYSFDSSKNCTIEEINTELLSQKFIPSKKIRLTSNELLNPIQKIKKSKEKHLLELNTKSYRSYYSGEPESSYVKLFVKEIVLNDMCPCIIFVPTKKNVMKYTSDVCQYIKENHLFKVSDDSKKYIDNLFEEMTKNLPEIEKSIDEFDLVKQWLKTGIGAHNAGLLPLSKEITEICFMKQIIKVLFATQTFSVGVNSPTRTCAFVTTKVYDNDQGFVDMKNGQYQQMSGRAGRKGFDDYGNVIFLSTPKFIITPQRLHFITEHPKEMESKFSLNCDIVLKWLKNGKEDIEKKVFESFDYFNHLRLIRRRDIALRFKEQLQNEKYERIGLSEKKELESLINHIVIEQNELDNEIERIKESINKIMSVLEELDFTYNGIPTEKGKYSWYFNIVDRVLMTNIMYNKCFEKLNNGEILSFLSVFVSDCNKRPDEKKSEVHKKIETLIENEIRLIEISEKNNKINEQEQIRYRLRLSYGMVDGVCILSNENSNIKDVVSHCSDKSYGKLIYCIKRIRELLRELIFISNELKDVSLLSRFDFLYTLLESPLMTIPSIYTNLELVGDLGVHPIQLLVNQ
ncbi:helicase, putative [Entamoeba dispar SAW760]|uniref:Helicase, putative n=1 Tax=Entamoeba dispar (strain ATCC PRA-260 / SAW760) TaxID=370354 RepID=B0ECV3_ENTDS|nr:helicase, putative [Entamoeba dispar SAW760]EDR27645.1 helicase, putative [Entamoeba dispar SAW760]|eukprot:EDR27645.1 helicase, putative [Entamoeba dispar SAW760]